MRLASFKTPAGQPTIGLYKDGVYVDLHALSDGALPDVSSVTSRIQTRSACTSPASVSARCPIA